MLRGETGEGQERQSANKRHCVGGTSLAGGGVKKSRHPSHVGRPSSEGKGRDGKRRGHRGGEGVEWRPSGHMKKKEGLRLGKKIRNRGSLALRNSTEGR